MSRLFGATAKVITSRSAGSVIEGRSFAPGQSSAPRCVGLKTRSVRPSRNAYRLRPSGLNFGSLQPSLPSIASLPVSRRGSPPVTAICQSSVFVKS